MATATSTIDKTAQPRSRNEQSLAQKNGPRHSLAVELSVVACVFAVTSFICFTGLGDVPLFNPDECFFAESAREMLVTGNFITSTFNFDIRYTKPPLHLWGIALCYALFGCSEFSARFFGAACAAILIVTTYCFINKFVGMRAGLIATAMLLTSPLYMVTGRLSITEMPLSLFTATGLFCFYSAFQEKRISFAWLGYALLAAGMMTKGPVGIVLPVLVLAVYHLMRRNFLAALAFYKPHIGAIIASVLALPWYIIETIVTGGEYFTCFIVMENFQRFTAVVSGHDAPWWYHLAAVGGGFLPWSVFLPQAIAFAAKQPLEFSINKFTRGNNFRDNSFHGNIFAILDRFRELDPVQDLAFFALCFLGTTIVFYSASVSKLLSYTVCCFPALAMVCAILIDRLIAEQKVRSLIVPILILATVCGIGTIVEPTIMQIIQGAPQNIGGYIEGYGWWQFAAYIAAIGLIAKKRSSIGVALICLSTVCATSFYGYHVIQNLAQKDECGLPELARFAAASKDPIFVYKSRLPSVPFYTLRKTELSPAQEIPIENTHRYTGVAGQSQPPSIVLFDSDSEEIRREKTEARKLKRFADRHHVSIADAKLLTRFLPDYERLTATEVIAEVQKRERAYVLLKKVDLADLQQLPGYKKISEAGSYALLQWIKPTSQTSI